METQWSWAAASRCGTSHLEVGSRRQDAFRVIAPAPGRVFAAVACDGAGSASHGGEGASLAARTLSSLMAGWIGLHNDLPDEDMVSDWVEIARQRIAHHAIVRQISMHDMATTVVLALSYGGVTMAAQIGDGAIVGRCANTSTWTLLSGPEHGKNACETFFLTAPEKVRLRQTFGVVQFDRLVLFTDGIERLALNFPGAIPHSPFFDGICEPVVAATSNPARRKGFLSSLSIDLGQYLVSPEINERTDDDKTLIVGVLA